MGQAWPFVGGTLAWAMTGTGTQHSVPHAPMWGVRGRREVGLQGRQQPNINMESDCSSQELCIHVSQGNRRATMKAGLCRVRGITIAGWAGGSHEGHGSFPGASVGELLARTLQHGDVETFIIWW